MENDVLKKYRQFYEKIDWLLDYCELNDMIINDKVAEIYQYTFVTEKIYETAREAKIELENLMYSQNNNSNLLLKKLSSDYKKLDYRFKAIENSNQLIKKIIESNISRKKDYIFSKITINDRKKYLAYSKINSIFFGLYNSVIEIKNRKPAPQPLDLQGVILPEKYEYIMNLLVEKKYCDRETLRWISVDNGQKSMLAELIKYLIFKGYTIKRSYKTEEIQEIISSTFEVDVSKRTIQAVRPAERDRTLDFIPANKK